MYDRVSALAIVGTYVQFCVHARICACARLREHAREYGCKQASVRVCAYECARV